MTAAHHLLPHERWVANRVVASQQRNPTLYVIRMQRKYGPEGIRLIAAAEATIIPGACLVIAGFAILMLSIGIRTLTGAAFTVMAIGVALHLAGVIRVLQAIRVRSSRNLS